VKSKSAAMLAGRFRYGIELWDTSTERDILVNHELVIAGHAQATLEYHKVSEGFNCPRFAIRSIAFGASATYSFGESYF
jgi:hypothetical protein